MVKSILTLILSVVVSLVLAQASDLSHKDTESYACGQVNTPEQIAFLKANNPNLSLSFRPSMDTIRVPVLFQRIADENGNGAVSLADCAAALADLNALYAPGRIVFEECEAPRLIADSTFFDYQYSEEFDLRQAHEVPGVINVFIPNRASSTSGGQVCGYAYLPPTRRDITIVRASCFTNGTTFPHEVGHFLGLYHTHGTSNCGSLTDELVDGSNCDTRGDDVCDTPADPNLLGVDCDGYVVNSSCVYTGTELDANGDAFAPNPRNIMSYSRKACREGFSIGQLDRVRFYLGSSRSYLTCPVSICETTNPSPTISDYNMTTFAVDVQDNEQVATEFEWSVVGGRTFTNISPLPQLVFRGYTACDSIRLRARNICEGGIEGEWSDYIAFRLEGCGLQYCPQANDEMELEFSDLKIGDRSLVNLVNADNYGVHADGVSIALDDTDPKFELSFEVSGTGTNTPDSMYVQVWIDVNNDDELVASERTLQVKASTSEVFDASIQVGASIPRSQQMRMRITASVESFIEPCETEKGETEDVNIVFEADPVSDMLQWALDSIELDAPMQSIMLSLTSDVNWSIVGLPSWLSTTAWNGTAQDTVYNLDVQRNEGCETRMHTLILAGPNGLTDELVVTQNPAETGITVISPDTIFVGPYSGAVAMSSTSAHLYQVEGLENWVNLSESGLIDSNTHRFSYAINRTTDDRASLLVFEGCGEMETVTFFQESGRTSWESTIDVQIQAVGDIVELPILSNNEWDALSDKAWLSPVSSSGNSNGVATFVYTGNAYNEEVAEVSLSATYGMIEGPTTVRVIAPFVSGTQQPRLSAKLIMANPISDRLVASTASAKTYSWSVFSSLGQRMHASFGESLNLETTLWPAGTYFVKLEDEDGRILVERIVKF